MSTRTLILTVVVLLFIGAALYLTTANRSPATAPEATSTGTDLSAAITQAVNAAPNSTTPSPPKATSTPRVATTSTPTTTTPQDICQSLPRSPITNARGITSGPIVSFDFDDGFISSYQYALPIINGAGYPTTQYIITGDLNKTGHLNAQQVLAMQAAGNEIGAHTRTHPFLTRLAPSQVIDEVCGSRQDLLGLGIKAQTFAYPEGDFNPAVEAVVQSAGFAGARITRAGLDNSTTNPFLLHSYQMGASTTFPQIKFMIDQAIADKEWLPIVFHRTNEAGNAISVSSDLIQQIVNYVKSKNVPVVTESQGLGVLAHITNTISNLNDYVSPAQATSTTSSSP